MKIVSLQATNVKRLKAVRITPDGSMVNITGRNGAGKSSVLDSIQMAFAGKDAIPPEPVRRGQKKGEVVVETEEYIVRRVFDAKGGDSVLTVSSKQGAKYPSPQALLDKVIGGGLQFDPLAFERMKPADQMALLKRLAGLDFTALDRERKEIFEARTVTNRDVKALEAQVASMPEPDVSPEAVEVSITSITSKIRDHMAVQAARADAIQKVKDCEQAAANITARVLELEKQVAAERERAADAREAAAAWRDKLAEFPDMSKPIADANKELEEVDDRNRAVRARVERDKKVAALDAARKQSGHQTTRLDEIDAEKVKAVETAKMPVEGLGLSEVGVTFGGIPFEQCASSERLRVSVAIGLALNPKLKVLLIRDGSLLDAASLKVVAEMAETAGAQVWLETVTNGEPIGIVIEDGEVKDNAPAEGEKAG